MYANIRWKPNFSKWDGDDAEALRAGIIKDTNNYLDSGECPEDLEPEVRKTLRKIETETDHEKLRKLIQDYFFELFDSMQFFDADPQEAAEGEFPIYREVLGLEWIDVPEARAKVEMTDAKYLAEIKEAPINGKDDSHGD